MPLVLTRNPALLSLLTGFGAFLEAVASATHSVRVVAYIGVGLVIRMSLWAVRSRSHSVSLNFGVDSASRVFARRNNLKMAPSYACASSA